MERGISVINVIIAIASIDFNFSLYSLFMPLLDCVGSFLLLGFLYNWRYRLDGTESFFDFGLGIKKCSRLFFGLLFFS